MFRRIFAGSLLALLAVPGLISANTTGGDPDPDRESINPNLPGHWTYHNLDSYAENQGVDTDEATRRLWIEFRAEELIQAVMNDPDNFGGAWIKTTPDEYTVIVNTLGNRQEEKLADLVTDGDPVTFTEVKHSLTELRDIAAKVTDNIQENNLVALPDPTSRPTASRSTTSARHPPPALPPT